MTFKEWPEGWDAHCASNCPGLKEGTDTCSDDDTFMSQEIVSVPTTHDLHRAGVETLPAPIAHAGENAVWRFIEFFTANIRNRNTRAAYIQAAAQFFRWCKARGIRDLDKIKPVVIAAYIEQHQAPHRPSSSTSRRSACSSIGC